ncbi:hypothetical protein [Halorhodospira sp. 9622]|uniref:rolling circle replication-associated protein n=1 Tax=Halorhodospira sp. 9622 TaxID=2899136 RepID=UPI001EE78876|nr:hypothetical protein [Halorhodospira sp. 9622]MCG5539470.1 hypothetical protein [Halorhodospira sp. 9622]
MIHQQSHQYNLLKNKKHCQHKAFNEIVIKKDFTEILPNQELVQANKKQFARSEVREWLTTVSNLNKIKWEYFVTLTFRNEITSYEESKNVVSKFLKNLNNEIFGKRSKKSLQWLVFIEKSQYHGYHVHLIIGDFLEKLSTDSQIRRCGNEELFKYILEKTWNNVDQRTGKPDFHSFESSFQHIYNDEALYQYLTKQLGSVGSEVFAFDLMNLDGRYNKLI